MLSRIKKLFTRKENKNYAYLQSQLCFLNRATFSPLRYDIFSFDGYMSNPIVYRCINLIATSVAGIPWILYKKMDNGKDIEMHKHPILDLLCKPNPKTSQFDFFVALISYLQVSGNTYVKCAGPTQGPPRELYTLRPDFFNIVDNSYNTCYNEDIFTYHYTCNGLTEEIPSRLLWHGKLWNPLCQIYGLSPVQAAWRSVAQLNEAMNWNVALLQNSASPSGVLTAEGNLTDEQVARLKEQLALKYQSMANAGRAMVLDGGLKWEQMSLSPRDMAWDEGQKMATKNICVALGVDPVLLGDADNRTYATYKDAEKSFYVSTILPNLDRLRDDFLNGWLLPKFPGTENMFFEYDMDAIEVLSEDRGVIWDRAISGVKEGLITVNEARNSIGYSELVNSSNEKIENETPQENNKKSRISKKKKYPLILKSFNISTKQDQQEYINSIERLRKSWENKMEVQARKVLTTEKNNILKEIVKKKLEHKTNKKLFDRLINTINKKEWDHFYKYLYTNVTRDFGERALNDYEIYGEDDEEQEDWFVLAVAFFIPVVNQRIKEVTETSRDRLINLLQKAEEANSSLTDIIKQIEELYDHDIPIRSKNISTTEVITAGNIGLRFAVKSLNLTLKKQWISVMDERTRPSHWNTNGEIKEIDELYSNGLMFPGDPNAPAEEVINCRCIENFIS